MQTSARAANVDRKQTVSQELRVQAGDTFIADSTTLRRPENDVPRSIVLSDRVSDVRGASVQAQDLDPSHDVQTPRVNAALSVGRA